MPRGDTFFELQAEDSFNGAQAIFESSTSEGSHTDGGCGRSFLVARGRRIGRDRCSDRGHAVTRHNGVTPNHSRRGRDRGRQLGDVLRVRQGNGRHAPAGPADGQGLRRLQGLRRQGLPRLPRLWQRLQRLRRLRRLRLRWVRLLLDLGSLPRLLIV